MSGNTVPTLVGLNQLDRLPGLIRSKLARRLARRPDYAELKARIDELGRQAAATVDVARQARSSARIPFADGLIQLDRVDLLARGAYARADGLHGQLTVVFHGTKLVFWLPWLYTEGV